MKPLLVIYTLLAAAAVVGTLAAMLAQRIAARRRTQWSRTLGRQYLRLALTALLSESGRTPRFPRAESSGARLVLAETLSRIAASTYGSDTALLHRMAEENGVVNELHRRARRTRGYRRAYYLALLSRIAACDGDTAARYRSDRNRSVRFYALLTDIACNPSSAVRLLEGHPERFTPFELSEIMSVLRRGMLPIAYEPLIASDRPNLQAVGLTIVRLFGIERAEPHLLRIVDAEEEAPAREALYALCSMRRPLFRREVVRLIGRMRPAERRALLRYMALEGYSAKSLELLFRRDEQPYFEAWVASYKRRLVWS